LAQREPFHRSVNPDDTFEADSKPPTAMHSFKAGHDTPSNSPDLNFGGRGVRSIDQWEPFHRSAKGTVVPPEIALPTAVHA